MRTKDKRPVDLNLFKFCFPITAITSILHRISGVLLFFCAPIYFKLWWLSLASQANFQKVVRCVTSLPMRFFSWVILGTFVYHFLAGVRHLVMDFGLGEHRCVARCTSKLILWLSLLFWIALGVWLW